MSHRHNVRAFPGPGNLSFPPEQGIETLANSDGELGVYASRTSHGRTHP